MNMDLNPHLLGFRCTTCDATIAPEDVQYTCPRDGGNLDAVYDYAAISRNVNPLDIATDPDRSTWHYAPLHHHLRHAVATGRFHDPATAPRPEPVPTTNRSRVS